MNKQSNISLKEFTSIHVGGIAKELYTPSNTAELLEVINDKKPKYFVGGGTNLLINDREFDTVISLRSFDTSIENLGNGQFKVGASVRLQRLINTINDLEYGGIEYLYSVPGLVGGAVVMNAGRGREHKKCISDYIVSVSVIRDNELIDMPRDECKFEYRNSVFRNSSMIVVSVLFEFPRMNKDESSKAKKERIELCREKQDASHPNFGTVFMQANPKIMAFVRKLRLGGKNAHFSGKTSNWIVNEGNASYEDVFNAIRKVEIIHKVLNKKCEREVIVWR